MRPLERGRLGRGLVVGAGALALMILSSRPSLARAAHFVQVTTGSVQGTVLDAATGMPVPGAIVRAPGFSLETATDAAGRFGWSGIALASDAVPAVVEVTADGYGAWRIENVRLRVDDTLILDVSLGAQPVTIIVPDERPADGWPTFPTGTAALDTLLDNQSGLPLPSTIRVRITGNRYCNLSLPYTVETIDFKEYVKHVLPNEWIASWPHESLRAGAMAAKMYAWSYIAIGGKWPDADVYDSTCDQVYIPSVSYASTNAAVDFTWNWRLLQSDGQHLFRTYYRAYASQCAGAGLAGYCMGQYESRDMAYDLYTWDEILAEFYTGSQLNQVYVPPGGYSLRYYGYGYGDQDRVKVAIDDPTTIDPGPPSDVGSTDFALEWWMKVPPGENPAALPACGADDSWRRGNVIIDRDRFNQNGDYGVSLGGGRIAFGVTGSDGTQRTLCGSTPLADGAWHHVAVQRRLSDGWMSIYVDGALDAEVDGPDGNIAYPDTAVPLNLCGSGGTSPCANDPYLVFGAEKHDQLRSTYLSFHGWLDEIRLSNILRYSAAFTRPASPFSTDASTVGLWHFDEGYGNVIHDYSVPDGPSPGDRNYGGHINGPEWTDDVPWSDDPALFTVALPLVLRSYPPPPLVFAVISDYGWAGQPEADVATLVKSWSPAFIVTSGDNNQSDDPSLIDVNIGQYYSDFIHPYTGSYGNGGTENRFFPAMGNHDWNGANGSAYLDYFSLPGNERYYSFVRGSVEFFVLDSDDREPDGTTWTSLQAAWLQNGLAASTAPWQIVVLHHAPYSSGLLHGSSVTMQQWPFADWGADAVLAGHDHDYERLTVDGIPYIVNGLGGRSIRGFVDPPLPESQVRYSDNYGAMRVEASLGSLVFEFISRDGTVRDRHVVNATPSFGDVPATHWAFPYIETLYHRGYVAGCSATPRLYCPERVLTRAESSVFILRGAYGNIASPPHPAPASPSFADVASSFWGFGWIENLYMDGYTAGCGTNPLIFCPLRNHTRAEGAVFFLRIRHGISYAPPAPTGLFADAGAGAWYQGWVEAAYNEGLLPACASSPLRICPDEDLDRSWAAYMMVRAKDMVIP